MFSINVATVIGPTPPGTGVICEANWLATANSTSPTNLLLILLIPISTTIDPFLIHSPLTKFCLPAATTTKSA